MEGDWLMTEAQSLNHFVVRVDEFLQSKKFCMPTKKRRGDACVDLNLQKVDGVYIQTEERPKLCDGAPCPRYSWQQRNRLKEVAKDLKSVGVPFDAQIQNAHLCGYINRLYA